MKHHRSVRQGMGNFTMLFDEIDYSDKKKKFRLVHSPVKIIIHFTPDSLKS